jgi:cytosine/adenosine deaminase-related metal-dependent hydrolase
MPRFTADWVLPIAAPPIRRGWVDVADGRIVAVGAEAANNAATEDVVELGAVALLPGLVNAHTHLELSHLRGKVARADHFIDWVRAQLAIRRQSGAESAFDVAGAARQAIDEARASGTVLFGDVANSPVTIPLLEAAGMPACVFIELLGFNVADPAARVREARAAITDVSPGRDRVRVSLAPHAPYSVSPALFQAIKADLDEHPGTVSTVHLAESPEEVEFLASGTGGWRRLLDDLGAWNPAWRVPQRSSVGYLDDLGFLDGRVLAVHAVQCSGEDLRRLGALGVTVVACPRSNQYVGVGAPPLEAFYAMDVDVAFGTDSLASVESLSLFDELAEARRIAPRVPASALLRSATVTGARALGFGDDYGSLEPGRMAAMIAVRVPPDTGDVEEYLVGGIADVDISWVTR